MKSENKVLSFLKSEYFLVITVLLTLLTVLFVKPSGEYSGYFDLKSLAEIFAFLCVTRGLYGLGIFDKFGEQFAAKKRSALGTAVSLTFVSFVSSIFLFGVYTIPFMCALSDRSLEKESDLKNVVPPAVMRTVVTVAAGAGNMLTPLGNPVNLVLTGAYGLTFHEYLIAALPWSLGIMALVMIFLFVSFKKKTGMEEKSGNEKKVVSMGVFSLTLTELFAKSQTGFHSRLIMYLLLYIVDVLTVLDLLPWQIMLAITVILVLMADRKTFTGIRYTEVIEPAVAFVFAGNLSALPAISKILRILSGRSAVPCVIILTQLLGQSATGTVFAHFTTDPASLIISTGFGGLIFTLIKQALKQKKGKTEQ